MIYRVLQRMIKQKRTDGIQERIDVFYAVGKLTEEEYRSLLSMLNDTF